MEYQIFIIHLMFYYLIEHQVFWVVHDEIESLHKQAIIDMAKFVVRDVELDRIAAIATGTAGITSGAAAGVILLVAEGLITGGELEVQSIKQIIYNNLNSLSTNTFLEINNLNATSHTFLELIMVIQLKYQI